MKNTWRPRKSWKKSLSVPTVRSGNLEKNRPAGRSVKGWKKSRRDPLEGYGKSSSDYKQKKTPDGEKEYLLVDGYNIIFAWEDLKELAAVNIDGARERLMDILM